MNRLRKWGETLRGRLRPEEVIALFFLLPFLWMAWRHPAPARRFPTMVVTCLLPAILVAAMVLCSRRSPRRLWQVARDFLPFVLAVWMYENMHDVTMIFHLPDRHEWLIRADEWMFRGVNPVVWMERWIDVRLTGWMIVAYSTYYFYPPLLCLKLYLHGPLPEFRQFILALVLTFYTGLLGYVLVPALDPGITMRQRFSVDLRASPMAKQALDLYTISRLKVARDCFPSLHTAVSLVVLAFAWRSWRSFFWVALPGIAILIFSTVYLRLHYVIDLMAGLPLAWFSVGAARRLHRWWDRGAPADGHREAVVPFS